MSNIKKLNLQSKNIAAEQVQKLKLLFPEVFTEGGLIDFEKLRLTLGEQVEKATERFGLHWPGKKDCFKAIQQPSLATLKPNKEASINWDATKHIFIEGENLEVLKLLQKSYFQKVKMIYIDPPYNTGQEFIYLDNFTDNIPNYLAYSGQVNKKGHLFSTNVETEGRFHAQWLNMMYPRLFLARNLLREDGIIFISIGDNELDNLKKICNEIFGEENFRNLFAIRRHDKNLNKQFIKNGLKSFNVGLEYILAYSKSEAFSFLPVYKELSEKRKTTGYWKGFWNNADRPTMRYDILGYTPQTGQWKWSKERADIAIKNYQEYLENFASKMTLEEYWEQTGKTKEFIKRNPKGRGKNKGVDNWIAPSEGKLRTTNWSDLLASKSDATTQHLFDFPKNPEVLKLLIQSVIQEKNETVLDFFAGSSSTAHAVLKFNESTNLAAQFIMVQLPESTGKKSKAKAAGFDNIATLSIHRIKNVLQAIGKKSNKNSCKTGLGLKVFQLKPSNFKAGNGQTGKKLKEQLKSEKDILYEILLKSGYELNASIEEIQLAGKKVFSIAKGSLLICLEKLTAAAIVAMAQKKPNKIVCLDTGFQNNNPLKINAMQIMKSQGIIDFSII